MAEHTAPRRYFAERRGRGPKLNPLPFERVRQMVVGVLDRFRDEGYFQEAFGYDCVDAGEVTGTLGSFPDAYFLRTIHREDIWPYWFSTNLVPRWEQWDEDTLFDVVEVLHDLVSRGVEGRYHQYNHCGWHYDEFDRAAGQRELRDELNQILPLGSPAYEIEDSGQIIERGPAAFRTLVDAPVPESADEDLITQKIEGAIARFRARGADNEERRVAVRELADVLEALRRQVKEHMLSADESALFHIANRFVLRHHSRDQRGDYDRATWLSWAFYVYLATIHAVLRIIDRQQT
jgi:hypothetical protein